MFCQSFIHRKFRLEKVLHFGLFPQVEMSEPMKKVSNQTPLLPQSNLAKFQPEQKFYVQLNLDRQLRGQN